MWLKILWRGDSIVGHHAFFMHAFCSAPNYNTIKKMYLTNTTNNSRFHCASRVVCYGIIAIYFSQPSKTSGPYTLSSLASWRGAHNCAKNGFWRATLSHCHGRALAWSLYGYGMHSGHQ